MAKDKKKPVSFTVRITAPGAKNVREAMAAYHCSFTGDCYPYKGGMPDIREEVLGVRDQQEYKAAVRDCDEATLASIED